MTSTSTLVKDSLQSSGLSAAVASDAARSRFVTNVASNVAFTVINTVVRMWYTPFLIQHLGIAVYGILPLANMLIPYMALFADSLNVATSRFLAIDLNRADETAANRTFNTALLGSTGVVATMFPLGLVVVWFFPTLFHVPPESENDARLLFGCVLATFFLTTIGSNFELSTFILHRFDLRNLIKLLTLVAQVGLVALLFALLPAQLWHVSLGILAAAVVFFAGCWFWWRRLTPQLRIKPSDFDRSRLRELLSMSGWTLINQAGNLLFLNIDLIVVNAFFGAEMTGRYGTILLFSILIFTLAETVSSVLSPAVMARYAHQDYEGMRRIVYRAVKLMGIALALPIGLLCGFARPLLTIWLGSDFQTLDILLIVLLGHLCVNLATLPLRFVLTSYNKVRLQGMVTLLLGLANLGLAVALAAWGGWGAVGVAAAGAIVWTARNLFFITSYSAHVMNLQRWRFYPALIAGPVGTLLVGLGAYGLTKIWTPQNWFGVGGMAVIVSLGYAVFAYSLSLNREDRRFLLDLIPVRAIRNRGR